MANQAIRFTLDKGQFRSLQTLVEGKPKEAEKAFRFSLIDLRRRLTSELNRELKGTLGVRPRVFLGKERHSRLRFGRSPEKGVRIWIGQNDLLVNAWVSPTQQAKANRGRQQVKARGKSYAQSFWGRNPNKVGGYLPFQRVGRKSIRVIREPIRRETDPIITRVADKVPSIFYPIYERKLRQFALGR